MLFLHYAFIVLVNKMVPVSTFALYEGVGLYFNENKIHELLVYAMDVAALFGLFGVYLLRKNALETMLRRGFGRMYLHVHRSVGGATALALLSVLFPVALCFSGARMRILLSSQGLLDSRWSWRDGGLPISMIGKKPVATKVGGG